MKRLFMIGVTLLATQVLAGEAQPVGEDPQIEQRLNVLAEDLRCLVCQNESLAGSHAELAEDLRREIRDQMKQGKDDKQVVEYLVARYGDFVLYKPPFKPLTLVLWLGPLVFLLVGGITWWTVLKRRRAQPEGMANTQARAEAARILEGKSE
jgi:cytochrome c-type biogenesis protein CcmH